MQRAARFVLAIALASAPRVSQADRNATIRIVVAPSRNPLEIGPQNISVTIDARDIRFEEKDGRCRAKLEVIYLQQAADRRQIAGFRDKFDLNLEPGTYERILREGIRFTRRVNVAMRAARFRILVRDLTTAATGAVEFLVQRE